MKVLLKMLLLSLLSLNAYAIDATHGMVLFGEKKLMAYHLPMFHKIHARQIVLDLETNSELKAEIVNLHKENKLLTFVPAPFDLDKFLTNPHTLKGDIYLGHFEKDGVMIHEGVDMNINKVVFNQPLKKQHPRRNYDNYSLFGTIDDLYLVHLIDGGFHQDHIVKATLDKLPVMDNYLIDNALISNESFQFQTNILEMDQEIDLAFMVNTSCRNSECPMRIKRIPAKVDKVIFSDHVM